MGPLGLLEPWNLSLVEIPLDLVTVAIGVSENSLFAIYYKKTKYFCDYAVSKIIHGVVSRKVSRSKFGVGLLVILFSAEKLSF